MNAFYFIIRVGSGFFEIFLRYGVLVLTYTVGGPIKGPAIKGPFPKKNEMGVCPLIISQK